MVFYIEPHRDGLDRRVFRRMDNGGVEWAYYFDWNKDPQRARYFGFALRNPQNIVWRFIVLNDNALQAAYAAAPADKRDMNLIATVVRAYMDADENIAAGGKMLRILELIEDAGIKGYLTPDLCARLVSDGMTPEAYRLADYAKGERLV